MTERERLILNGKKIDPLTADEAAISTAIDNAGSGGGSDLPTPGTAGNVLTSTGTAWESAAPTDTNFQVTADLDATDISFSNFSASYSEIVSAANANKNVVLHAIDTTINAVFNARLMVATDIVIFCGESYIEPNHVAIYVIMNSNNEIDVNATAFVPLSSDDDNGKILGVNSGGYALISPSELSNAPLIVHGTISNGDFSFSDTTVKDVYDAKVANRAVFLDDGDGYRWELTGALYFDATSEYAVSFGCLKINPNANTITAAAIGIGGVADTTTGGSVYESDLTINNA